MGAATETEMKEKKPGSRTLLMLLERPLRKVSLRAVEQLTLISFGSPEISGFPSGDEKPVA